MEINSEEDRSRNTACGGLIRYTGWEQVDGIEELARRVQWVRGREELGSWGTTLSGNIGVWLSSAQEAGVSTLDDQDSRE